ncbi:MAG: HD domain-containing protein, partial [Alphaproteobacteria bacterium]|nr:HD domain-containing protein [Alphaproteobacteria bacterium]
MKIYEVGGCVRDKLLGKTPSDFDHVVVGATIDEMLTLSFKQVGKSFPVFIKDGKEYALARKEIKTGNKHGDFKFIFTPDITLEDDLKRRDFTCNALAYDKENNKIIDYHNGVADIRNKILRHVNSDHFPEDPLRIFRMCRFSAQLDFSMASETLDLAKSMVSQGMLAHLSAERIWQEIHKALATPRFDKFILSMRECDALKVILPEIDEMFSTPKNLKTHPEGNVGAHTILALQQVANSSPIVKFATLMHDVGKILTPKEQLPNHAEHETTGPELINKICLRLKTPNNFREFAKTSCRYHGYFHHILKLSPEDLYQMLFALKKFNIDNLIAFFRSDYFGRNLTYPKDKQQEKEEFFRKMMKIFKDIKATDMPDFENINKDSDFKEKLRKFQISKLKE